VPAAVVVKAKKRCCKDNPRCKKCPVVLKKLERQGLAERHGKRTYTVRAKKRDVKAARKR
jgi:hypothetical protein